MVGPIFVVSGITIIGILCTFFARQIQRYLIWSCDKWPPIFKGYPPQQLIRSELYIWELRFIGVIALAVGPYHLGKILLH